MTGALEADDVVETLSPDDSLKLTRESDTDIESATTQTKPAFDKMMQGLSELKMDDTLSQTDHPGPTWREFHNCCVSVLQTTMVTLI